MLSIKRIPNTLSRTAFRSSFAHPFRSFYLVTGPEGGSGADQLDTVD
ncbi:hypothetical protein I3843_15G065700 [Carya illinoinensis]|nr:hypothetical protein I3843_15G065700 [Carya illinoinensis]